MVLRLLRRSKAKTESRALPLAEAAKRVLEIARRESLPLAYIAGRGGEDRAQHWFANNMLLIVVARGRAPSATEREELTPGKIRGLELDADMNTLREAGATVPRYVDLTLSSDAVERYLDWARTVQ